MTDKKVRCNEKVAMSNGWGFKSCSRAAVCGDKCKQHSEEAKEERAKKSHEAYLKKVAESPYKKIAKLTTALLEAQADNARLRKALKWALGAIDVSDWEEDIHMSEACGKYAWAHHVLANHTSSTALQEHDNALLDKVLDIWKDELETEEEFICNIRDAIRELKS